MSPPRQSPGRCCFSRWRPREAPLRGHPAGVGPRSRQHPCTSPLRGVRSGNHNVPHPLQGRHTFKRDRGSSRGRGSDLGKMGQEPARWDNQHETVRSHDSGDGMGGTASPSHETLNGSVVTGQKRPYFADERCISDSIEDVMSSETSSGQLDEAPSSDINGSPVISSATGRAVFEVLRLDPRGNTRRLYVKRRDLLRAHNIQPRDLRRIDPSLSVGKSIYSISVRENCLLIAVGGVRLIVAADRALLFEPASNRSKQFLDIALSHLQQQSGDGFINGLGMTERLVARGSMTGSMQSSVLGSFDDAYASGKATGPPFELEMVEAALIVATGALDRELSGIESRVQNVLDKLPSAINPTNLEELRRVKAALVDIESKADTFREVLEDLFDDEDEMREMNLSSRPKREEQRRQRERGRLERERNYELEREARRERVLAEEGMHTERADVSGPVAGAQAVPTGDSSDSNADPTREEQLEMWWEEEKMRGSSSHIEDVQEAMMAAEEAMEEQRELEQVEDMLDYYLQRVSMTEDEAQQLLTGARDLEESIGVSLSARRFELGRLELTLSIGSFAAALGAMIAGIFGMNLQSTLENSVVGFWGTTVGIVLGCCCIFWGLFKYAKKRRIL